MKWSWSMLGALVAAAGLLSACGAPEDELADPRPQSSAVVSSGLTLTNCGPDLARGKAVTSSGYWSTYAPGLAVDGDRNTYWRSSISDGAWLQVDLGQIALISRVVLTWGIYFGPVAESVLELSTDGTTWTRLTSVTHTLADSGVEQSVTFSFVAARYVRFRAIQWNVGPGTLSDLQVYGPCNACGATSFTLNKPVTSSGYWSTYTPSLAVDGYSDTFWLTSVSTGAWIQVDMGQLYTLGKAAVRWGWDTRFGTSATSALEASSDGATWTPLATFTHAREDSGVEQSATFPSVSARYVRFRATQWNGGWGSVFEIQVCGP